VNFTAFPNEVSHTAATARMADRSAFGKEKVVIIAVQAFRANWVASSIATVVDTNVPEKGRAQADARRSIRELIGNR